MTSLSASRAESMPRLASQDDQSRHQRVKISLLGRYMLADRCEYPCQTIDLSPGGLTVAAPVAPEAGTCVVVYLDMVGRLEGTISRHLEDGFALKLNTPARKREKLADQLT